jgi:hypothetical protein
VRVHQANVGQRGAQQQSAGTHRKSPAGTVSVAPSVRFHLGADGRRCRGRCR